MPRINRDWERRRSSVLNQGSEIALRGNFSGKIQKQWWFPSTKKHPNALDSEFVYLISIFVQYTVQLRACLDELTTLRFMAQRFGCKRKSYQKIWEKWMQISLLNFDCKQEKKENLFSIRDITSCPFYLIREGNEAFLFMLNLLLLVVDTISFKCALFLKIFSSQLHIELWWKKDSLGSILSHSQSL